MTSGSSGSGWRWTARSARRRWAGNTRARILRIEQKGAKRSLLTEGKGVPLGIAPAGANLNDFKLGRATIESIPIERPTPTAEQPQGLCLDKGYDYPEVHELCAEFAFTAHIRGRGEEAQALKRQTPTKARRWVVERTFGWLSRYRRLSRDYEYLLLTSECLIYAAMVRLMLRRLAAKLCC